MMRIGMIFCGAQVPTAPEARMQKFMPMRVLDSTVTWGYAACGRFTPGYFVRPLRGHAPSALNNENRY
ncbi:MAG: hypothetical protein ACYS8W_09980 [Planctomycetota bacterium]|jgi:hypothetical protein